MYVANPRHSSAQPDPPQPTTSSTPLFLLHLFAGKRERARKAGQTARVFCCPFCFHDASSRIIIFGKQPNALKRMTHRNATPRTRDVVVVASSDCLDSFVYLQYTHIYRNLSLSNTQSWPALLLSLPLPSSELPTPSPVRDDRAERGVSMLSALELILTVSSSPHTPQTTITCS